MYNDIRAGWALSFQFLVQAILSSSNHSLSTSFYKRGSGSHIMGTAKPNFISYFKGLISRLSNEASFVSEFILDSDETVEMSN